MAAAPSPPDVVAPPVAGPRLLFIVGRGRSGTTLLSRMLSRHPAVEVAPEGFFVLNLLGRHGTGAWDAQRIEAFCEDLGLERRMRSWGLSTQDVARRLRAAAKLDYATACRCVYASYAEHNRGRSGLSFVGDKNPHYALFTDRLAALFPEARFVHIVRDPRDNVRSYQSVPFDLQDAAALAARYRAYNLALEASAMRHPGRFHQLRYEDLVAAPEPTLGVLCEALGLAFDPAMLRFHEAAPEGFYGEESQWFQRLRAPLDPAQAQTWKTALAGEDLRVVESICAPLMKRFGYPRLTPEGAPSRRRGRAFAGALLGAASVGAERLVFGAVPAGLRSWAIDTYRSRTGRT